jgi:hypothetical protein
MLGTLRHTLGALRHILGALRHILGTLRHLLGFDLKTRVFAFFRQKPVKSVISSRCQSSLNQALEQVQREAYPL